MCVCPVNPGIPRYQFILQLILTLFLLSRNHLSLIQSSIHRIHFIHFVQVPPIAQHSPPFIFNHSHFIWIKYKAAYNSQAISKSYRFHQREQSDWMTMRLDDEVTGWWLGWMKARLDEDEAGRRRGCMRMIFAIFQIVVDVFMLNIYSCFCFSTIIEPESQVRHQ